MTDQPLHVLFLGMENAVQSILGEVLLRDLGGGRVRVFSAGRSPAGIIHPDVTRLLRRHGHETAGLFSKSIALFLEEGAPHVDLVISVYDGVAPSDGVALGDAFCPLGPMDALRVFWGVPGVDLTMDRAQQRATVQQSYRLLQDAVRRALQPSWHGLTNSRLQRLFQVVAPAVPGSELVLAG